MLHGDGSFGMNSMEFDTAMRHNLPILVVISHNGGWTADPQKERPAATSATRASTSSPRLRRSRRIRREAGRHPPGAGARQGGGRQGKPALVCVVTDWKARATTTAFTRYST